jgi:predicted acylesterase/phospholipase RssA
VSEARELLRLGVRLRPPDAKATVKRLKRVNAFGPARRLLARALRAPGVERAPEYVWLVQQHALCTYKDPDLPVDGRLGRALSIISRLDSAPMKPGELQETLGIKGGIHKRLWLFDNQKQNLERALDFYLRGYAVGAQTDEGRADVLAHLAAHTDAEVSTTDDNGYTGINAAFLLDQLAYLEWKEAGSNAPPQSAQAHRDDARHVRTEIVNTLRRFASEPGGEKLWGEWWFSVTVAEALFGLGRHAEAVGLLRASYDPLKIPQWEFETTIRQFAALAYLQSGAESGARFRGSDLWNMLADFLGGSAAAESVFVGKVGLALSGGGFRASLYHIGVLARLAELDVLRHVEVLSCVSGGSIVGAHYYLKVRKLLEEKVDGEIACLDYVRIVEELQGEFLAGVQRNVRTRVLADLYTNLKMAFLPNYSRTLRVGELYEREIFSRVKDTVRRPDGRTEPTHTGDLRVPDWLARLRGERRHPRYLSDLYVTPKDAHEDFDPKRDNWRREHKVPALILNATSLNTGHNWQFTASWMGEPPSGLTTPIDGNERLRRMYYPQAPRLARRPSERERERAWHALRAEARVKSRLRRAWRRREARALAGTFVQGWRLARLRLWRPGSLDTATPWRSVRLGHAVAASACVPGIFEPLVLEGLYPGRVVRLVDGGVCDNQGVAGLLEQDCTVVLVSDGSGQSASERDPSRNPLGVLWRSDNILQARVRETQYRELYARMRSSLLRGLMFLHLKQELNVRPQDWVRCPDPYNPTDDCADNSPASGAETGYGIDRLLQERLASIRTDLDSFHDVEAYALMASGYRMAREHFPDALGFKERCRGGWDFEFVGDRLHQVNGGRDEQRYSFLKRVFEVGGSPVLKVWGLHPVLMLLSYVGLGVAAALVVGAFIWLSAATLLGAAVAKLVVIPAVTVGALVLWLLGNIVNLAVKCLVGGTVADIIYARDTIKRVARAIAMCVAGCFIAKLHLYLFDRLYLNHGSHKTFKEKWGVKPSPPAGGAA